MSGLELTEKETRYLILGKTRARRIEKEYLKDQIKIAKV